MNKHRISNVRSLMKVCKPGVNEGLEVDFVSIFVSLGLILSVLGGVEVLKVPIIHIVVGVSYESFKIGSPIIPYIIVATIIPLVLEKNSRMRYVFSAVALCSVFLVDQVIGYSCSLPLSILLWISIFMSARRTLCLKKILLYSTILFTAYACLVGAYVLIKPVVPSESLFLNGFAEALWKIYSLFRWPAILLYAFLPYVLLIPILHNLLRRKSGSTDPEELFREETFSGKTSLIILVSSIGLAAYLAAYNYLPKRNPLGLISGVDVPNYASALESMINSSNPMVQAFSEPLSSTRPLYMLFLYSIHRITGLNAIQVAETAPVILLPLLVSSYYILVRSFSQLRTLGALAAILTLAGIQCSVGLFASFQANLLSLAVGNLLATLTLTVKDRKIVYPLASLISFSMMLIHSWTALYYITAITIALAYHTAKNGSKDSLLRVGIVILSALLSKPFVQAVQSPVEGSSDPLSAAGITMSKAFSIDNLEKYWSNTSLLLTGFSQGFMANTPICILSLIGIMQIRKMPEQVKWFLAAPLLALTPLPLMDYNIAPRMYFNTPLQIYASLSSYSMLQGSIGKKVFGITLITLSLTHTILAVANIILR